MTERLLNKEFEDGWKADGELLRGGIFKWRLKVCLMGPPLGWVHNAAVRPLFGHETLEEVALLFDELAASLMRIELARQAEIMREAAAHGVRVDGNGRTLGPV
ncbi:hypothetical protein [Ferrovibrio sp.]|uniref:hypothetical protein n=1 Tax=Ferrovibrio sp. TaxID=1917215 RepID=UPI003D0B1CF8